MEAIEIIGLVLVGLSVAVGLSDLVAFLIDESNRFCKVTHPAMWALLLTGFLFLIVGLMIQLVGPWPVAGFFGFLTAWALLVIRMKERRDKEDESTAA